MIFFEPTSEFADWLITYAAGREIVDVGCGDGLLLETLHKRGAKRLLGIDLDVRAARERLFPYYIHLMQDDACEHPIVGLNSQLIIIARPCHGSKFPHEVIAKCYNQAEILYIGFEKNHQSDFPDFHVSKQELFPPGLPEDIQIWSLGSVFKAECLQTWALILSERGTLAWWQYDATEQKLINAYGGYHHLTAQEHVITTVSVTKYYDLDWTVTTEYIDMVQFCSHPTWDQGWLAPDMQYYTCHYADHDAFAEIVFRQLPTQLEEAGWFKIHDLHNDDNFAVSVLADRVIGPFSRLDLKRDAAQMLAKQALTKEKLIERFPDKAELLNKYF